MDFYKQLLQPLLFHGLKTDPEQLHLSALGILERLQATGGRPLGSTVLAAVDRLCCLGDPRLTQTLWGLKFPNPFGLAAGFDKDGVAAGIWHHLGFGFAELGTVTWHSQLGNPKPRLFRLPGDRAVLNRMGFNNAGALALRDRLAALGERSIPLGVNLGKSKITPLTAAAQDYLQSFLALRALGDYFVVNVSSPNTPGLRSLQDAKPLGEILDALQQENRGEKPLLVKIAPDLSWEAISRVLDLTEQYKLAGIVATNTTIARDMLQTQTLTRTGNPVAAEPGGISGAPLRNRATEVIRFIRQQTGGSLPIIGVGGVFSAEDAWEKITAGASLVQVYTGWVYEGPRQAHRVLTGLQKHLEAGGFESVAAAVGSEVPMPAVP
ncbi:MAG: quinone-dependent dihydroorotate dehydrogenase [Cyanobacteria bacterium J06641_5]